jgi:hypothetical protein
VTTNEIKSFLLWCVVLNYAILFIWFGVFVFAHDWMYGIHDRWFKLSMDSFDAIHYAGLSVYKIGTILFNLVPLVALCLVSRRNRVCPPPAPFKADAPDRLRP